MPRTLTGSALFVQIRSTADPGGSVSAPREDMAEPEGGRPLGGSTRACVRLAAVPFQGASLRHAGDVPIRLRGYLRGEKSG